ncbi:MAG TPA: hypothetical protein VG518_02720 [Solirubrobacterales bacterium]|nr:hypothetical protein [Solirubrobacterales bacterium]
MLKKLESLLFGRRWSRDEHAWGVWLGIEPLVPTSFPEAGEHKLMAGRVMRVYQRARRGTKATVHFGPVVGVQDTWWPLMTPPVGRWVVVRAHLWLPPGTHSEQHVIWIEHWESWADGDVNLRALRHQRRMEKESLRAPVGLESGEPRGGL